MNRIQARKYARNLMDQHNLTDWRFDLDNAKRRAGLCDYRKKVISLSIQFILNNSEEEIRDTILHEIAHALAGPGNGHNHKWKEVCMQIGANPVRCYDSQKVKMPEGRYRATCPSCGRGFSRHKKPGPPPRFYFCRKCGKDKGRLTYKDKGK